jgi:hypothetical protein
MSSRTEYQTMKRIVARRDAIVTTKIDTDEARFEKLEKRDSDANRRLRTHLIFIVIGLAVTVGITFIPGGIILHLGGMMAGSPAIGQEINDWVHHW